MSRAFFPVGLVVIAALGCSSTPPPATPEITPEPEPAVTKTEPATADPPPDVTRDVTPEATPEKPPPSPTTPPDPARAVAHEITLSDCDALGYQLAKVTRSDQVAGLSPKLDADKRSAAENAIAEVANKVGERWADTCRNTLAGGTTDEASLKCAMRSKTGKEFETCLTGPSPAK